jgi:ubiquinone biosynthesis protein
MTPPSLGRLQAVAFVLARHGFGEIVARIGLLGTSAWSPSPSMAADAAAAGRERVGRRIARVLGDLGPTYIKLGQLLATREDLLPPEITTALRELHSAAQPMKPRVVTRLLHAALGQPPEDAFAWFDPTPLAAASIGQVHRARLHTGEEVVLKIQRPDLHRMVKGDLALMRTLAALLAQAVPEISAYDPIALLDAFERSIEAELDFRREADNARRLALLLAPAAEVRVPRIHAARPTLLVMEYVRGQKLASLVGPERLRARTRIIRAFVRQILEHGVFHADPHPGNLLVDDDGRIVLLDLGAVDEVDAGTRSGLLRVVLAIALHQPRALGAAVTDIAQRLRSIARSSTRRSRSSCTTRPAARTARRSSGR